MALCGFKPIMLSEPKLEEYPSSDEESFSQTNESERDSTITRTRIPYSGTKRRVLRFDGRVAIVTGAGRGIGRSLAIMYARRGAKVIVNDTGCSLDGEGKNRSHADAVVSKIMGFGGEAAAHHGSVLDGDKIVRFALARFGRIDILVCNAGVYSDSSFEDIEDSEWERSMDVHLHSTCRIIRDCWRIFCRQGYGRIALTGDMDLVSHIRQVSYSASKAAVLGLCSAISADGISLDINCNVYIPEAYTRMARDHYVDLSKSEIYNLHPKKIPPLIAVFTHESCKESGSIFQARAGKYYKLELKTVQKFTYDPIAPFDDILTILAQKELSKRESLTAIFGPDLVMAGRVAIVSGANSGLGQLISRQLIECGASVVIRQEPVTPFTKLRNQKLLKRASRQMSNRMSKLSLGPEEPMSQAADSVGNVVFVGDANCAKTVQIALRRFGRVDILFNCSSSPGISDKWHWHCKHHLDVAYLLSRAVWPSFKSQGYGRIVNIAPMGRPAVAFEPLKMGLAGFTAALSAEGNQHGIRVNTLMGRYEPNKNESQMAVGVACLLGHQDTPYQGAILEVAGDKVRELKFMPSKGIDLNNRMPTWDYPEALMKRFSEMAQLDKSNAPSGTLNDLVRGNISNVVEQK